MKKKQILLLISFMLALHCGAQDIHFTQYYTSPCNLNPALTGFFNGSQRFTLQNKSQWRSVTVPFRTTSVSCDMPVVKRYMKQDIFGGGVVINRDQAGDSKFGTTQVNFSGSYIRAVSRDNNQFISAGLMLGVAQRSLDYSELYFDSQYDGNSFDPGLPNNEQFAKSSFFFFDAGAGLYWHYIMDKYKFFNGGISWFHINNPRMSLFDNQSLKLDQKYMMHGSAQIDVAPKIFLLPGFIFMHQGKYNEFDIGSLVKFVKEPDVKNYLALQLGLYMRTGDAMNFIAGLDYLNWSLGISYDINTSNLVPASHSKGGFEISVIYILNTNARKSYVKKIPCPIF